MVVVVVVVVDTVDIPIGCLSKSIDLRVPTMFALEACESLDEVGKAREFVDL